MSRETTPKRPRVLVVDSGPRARRRLRQTFVGAELVRFEFLGPPLDEMKRSLCVAKHEMTDE